VTPAADAPFGDFGKQSFHKVQPTAAGRREVNVVPRVPRQPASHFGDLAGSAVIHHQVYVQAAGEIRLDVVEKWQELFMPMPSVAVANGNATGHTQGANKEVTPCRSKSCDWRAGAPGAKGRIGCVRFQLLNLALFVYTEDDRAIWWIQI
jgi:hypothetical protein